MGTTPQNTIWEFYNPTEETIDLRKYSLQRFDYDRRNGYPTTPTNESVLGDDSKWMKILLQGAGRSAGAKWELPPHKSIIFYSAWTSYSNSKFENRPGISYIVNFSYLAVQGGKAKQVYGWAFHVPQHSRHALVKDGKIVDNFFYGDGATKYTIPAGVFMRKPGRNLPRARMLIDVRNSDWVVREGTTNEDIGYRYSYYYDRSRLGDYYGNHWLEDTENKGTGSIKNNKLYNADYSFDATRSTSGKASKLPYKPPTWWTKARAEAADR